MKTTQHRRKPRLLYVENASSSFQSSRLALARAAAAHGFEVHAAVPFAECPVLDPDGVVEWHDLPMPRGLSPRGDATTIGCLIALYRRIRPDIVHHVRTKAIVYGSLAARAVRIRRVVNTLTGLGYVFHSASGTARVLRPAVIRALRLACCPAAQRLIVQNSDDFEACLRYRLCPADRLVLIKGSGVDLQKYRPAPEPQGPVLVVLPGRMRWDKGVREFVSAVEQLRSSGIQARFALVGGTDPDSAAAIPDACIRGWEESGIVEWWGWQADMSRVYAQAHIICLPSYGEGAPRALMEAAAMGRAIVTTDVAGCRDVVINNQNGLIVPPKDVPRLAAALGRLITEPELRCALARSGPEIMEKNFSLQSVIENNLAVYADVLVSGGGAPLAERECQEVSLFAGLTGGK